MTTYNLFSTKGNLGLFSLLALVLLVGCSDSRPERVPVSGQVLIDGEPLTHGLINFVNSNTRSAVGNLDSEGRFTASCFEKGDGVIPGPQRIRISADEGIDSKTVRWHAPKKYADEKTSGIEVLIEEPMDDLVIELTWDGGKPFIERN